MEMKVAVTTRINKPRDQVFKAVTEPDQLNRYFTSASSGPLSKGAKVLWEWHNAPGRHPVEVKDFIENQKITIEWLMPDDAYSTRVTLTFSDLDGGSTLLEISEEGFREDEQGLGFFASNIRGWQAMVDAMKAYLEYGVDLRD